MNGYDAALKVIMSLNSAGYDAFLVGGCVRSFLMNLLPADFDIATSASVEEVERVLDCRPIGSGEQHGTVKVIVDGEDHGIEVTTYRYGGKTLTDDLSRRDFTVNAIAWHPSREMIDPFGGREDIRNRVIRGVVDARLRFGEDPLRILRGLRFAALFGFRVEEETAEAVHGMAGTLSGVAPERVRDELTKILCAPYAESVLTEFADVLGEVIPEVREMIGFEQHNSYHYLDVYAHTVKVVVEVKNTPELRWAALFHDIAKPRCFFMGENGQGHFYGHDKTGAETAEVIMNRLRFDNATKRTVEFLISEHCINFPANTKTARRLLSRHGYDNVMKLLELQRADLAAHVELPENEAQLRRAFELIQEVIDEDACLKITDLAVNGHDMIALGLKGPAIGKTLAALLEAVVDGELSNSREELISFAKKIPPA
ncbi:MAG: HD domain-containing protein [Synergistaceae bacterium]|nr:HD domain-containing protein [Synergistaceae bacterium]